MNDSEIREWMDEQWKTVLSMPLRDPDPEIDDFIDSKITAIRYAVITQILGKIADPTRSLLYLQKGDGKISGAWNARSFCDSVIVPWVSDNHNVLGTSAEPYAGKPLRRLRLERNMNVRDKTEWSKLYKFLESLDNSGERDLRKSFKRCLESAARKLKQQSFKYQIPVRISLADLAAALEGFLKESSGGLRPLAVAVALMKVLGDGFSLFSEINSQGVNEADQTSGVPGDIMCYADDGNLALAIEVKDQGLTLAHVRHSTRKVKELDEKLENFLFATRGVSASDRDAIDHSITSAWASGLNLYQIDIMNLVNASFVLLGEGYRPTFLREIGAELDDRGDHAHRLAWHQILLSVGEDKHS